ncbi:MAG: YlxM family DNA-binding protein [Christensenellales bacterium]
MEKRFALSLLCDFYGPLLTENRLTMLKLYCDEDMTLQEIAEQTGITRQGVSDAIRRAERQLVDYEDKLGLLRRFRSVRGMASECIEILRSGGDTESAIRILTRLSDGEGEEDHGV